MELNGSRVLRESEGIIQRRCPGCKGWKTIEHFCPSFWNNGGPCRPCAAKKKSEWRRNNNEKYRERNGIYQKNYYKINKEVIKEKKIEYFKTRQDVVKATALLNQAVSRGVVQRPSFCSVCGISGVRIMGHHDDYSKPLKVRWVCQSCHQYIHNRQYELKEEGKYAVPKPRGPQTSHLQEARRLLGEVVIYMGMFDSYLKIQKFLQDSCRKGCQEIFKSPA